MLIDVNCKYKADEYHDTENYRVAGYFKAESVWSPVKVLDTSREAYATEVLNHRGFFGNTIYELCCNIAERRHIAKATGAPFDYYNAKPFTALTVAAKPQYTLFLPEADVMYEERAVCSYRSYTDSQEACKHLRTDEYGLIWLKEKKIHEGKDTLENFLSKYKGRLVAIPDKDHLVIGDKTFTCQELFDNWLQLDEDGFWSTCGVHLDVDVYPTVHKETLRSEAGY